MTDAHGAGAMQSRTTQRVITPATKTRRSTHARRPLSFCTVLNRSVLPPLPCSETTLQREHRMSGRSFMNPADARMGCTQHRVDGVAGPPAWCRSLLCGIALLFSAAACHRGEARHVLSLHSDQLKQRPIDPNGFLLNPRWVDTNDAKSPPNIEARCRFRVETLDLESRALRTTRGPCLADDERELVTLNEPGPALTFGLVCKTSSILGNVRGHVNWYPVTASGRLKWRGYSDSPGDHDLTMDLLARSPNASTSARPGAYHLEFSRNETLSRLGRGRSGWFPDLNRAVSRGKGRDRAAGQLVDDHFAIVTGTFGLDGVHGFHAELHPVFAMAVLVDARVVDGKQTENWALLVRNLGNEGDCASGKLPLYTRGQLNGRQDYVFNLGWLAQAESAHVSLGPSWALSRDLPTVRVARDSGVFLRFSHQRPVTAQNEYLFLGTIVVEWANLADGDPLARFRAQLASPDDPIALDEASAGSPLAATAPQPGERPDAQAGQVIDAALPRQPSLQELPAGRLPEDTTEQTPASEVVAYRSIPLADVLLPAPVNCDVVRPERICQDRWRLEVEPIGWIASGPLRGQYTPSASILLHAHSWRIERFRLAGFSELMSTLAWRVGLRRDGFIETPPGTAAEIERSGWSVRVSPVLGPNTWTPRQGLSFTPYVTGGAGVSFLAGTHARLAFSNGIGLAMLVKPADLHLEVQRYSVSRSVRSNAGVSIGISIPTFF